MNFSGTFLDLCDLYGILFVERLLRKVGLDRVLFGTDYPINAYERYYAALDEMEFTDAEIEQIAYGNAARLLTLGWAGDRSTAGPFSRYSGATPLRRDPRMTKEEVLRMLNELLPTDPNPTMFLPRGTTARPTRGR